MNTLQIERLLKKDLKSKTIFKKVCALDQLEKPTFPSAYVINSDPSSKPGEHWVAVYFDKRGRGEYFDSYGPIARSPFSNHFHNGDHSVENLPSLPDLFVV